jgi:hypothetical protein
MKTNDTKIITNFNIYITYKDKIKNVKIIFLLGNKYIKEEMCEKKVSKSVCMSCRKAQENRCNLLCRCNFFGGYCTSTREMPKWVTFPFEKMILQLGRPISTPELSKCIQGQMGKFGLLMWNTRYWEESVVSS